MDGPAFFCLRAERGRKKSGWGKVTVKLGALSGPGQPFFPGTKRGGACIPARYVKCAVLMMSSDKPQHHVYDSRCKKTRQDADRRYKGQTA